MQTATRYAFDNVELVTAERRLYVDGQPQPVGARAFLVLLTLLEHRDRVLTKDELLDAVWPNLVVEQNNVAVQIATLRKLLGPAAISTIPGRGYKYAGGPVQATTHEAEIAPASSAAARPVLEPSVPLIGRADDVQRVAALLASHRAVALTGPGGIGKTRVAQRVLCDVAHRYAQGTVWIDLSPSGHGLTLVDTIARTLGIELRPEDPLESLLQALQPRCVLVIVDHVEVAADDTARLVQSLMRRAPGLSFLLCGQVRLRLRDEQVVRLAGLSVPGHPMAPRDAMAHGAVALYAACAKAVDPQFSLDEGNVGDVIDLCRRLDGIPLAIDQAASCGRAPMGRERPLRAALVRSHALLAERERKLLRRLSVFDGAFTLAPVLDLMVGHGGLDTWDVLDALTELVDRSLVIVVPGEPPHYRLLACTRHFAAEQLAQAGEAATWLQRHAAAMSRPATSAAPRLQSA